MDRIIYKGSFSVKMIKIIKILYNFLCIKIISLNKSNKLNNKTQIVNSKIEINHRQSNESYNIFFT